MARMATVDGVRRIGVGEMTFVVGFCNCTRRSFSSGTSATLLRSMTLVCNCMLWGVEHGSSGRVTSVVVVVVGGSGANP